MPQTPKTPAEILEHLESIRALLGDDYDDAALDPDSIPLLSEVIGPPPPDTEGAVAPAAGEFEGQLREAAQVILQQVIDEFVPQIETELRRRLHDHAAALSRSPRE